MTKSQKIREYAQANQNAKAKDIAKECGVATAYVYQVLHRAKKKKANKEKPVAEKTPTEGQKTVRSELTRLHRDIDDWRSLYLSSFDEIEQLKQDVIGYRAVISYLQGQLDGLAV